MNKKVVAPYSQTAFAQSAREGLSAVVEISSTVRHKPSISSSLYANRVETTPIVSHPPKPQTAVHHIGLILQTHLHNIQQTNQFYAPVITAIEAFCRKSQINLYYDHLLVNNENSPIEIPPLLTQQFTTGLLIIGAVLNETTWLVLQKPYIPIVLVDAYTPGHLYDMVLSDNEVGAYQATCHLIENGHRHIAIVGGQPHSHLAILERRTGSWQAVTDHGLQPYFVDCSLQPDKIIQAVRSFLPRHPQVTAVFACNDDTAIATMQAAQTLGKQIPQDLSVIGYDDIALAQYTTPALTTMRVNKITLGRIAIQLLIERVEYPETGLMKTVIPSCLVRRQSVATHQ